MAIRANKVIEIKTENYFSLSEKAIVDQLPVYFWENLNSDGLGLTYLFVKDLKNLLKCKEIEKETKEDIKRWIKEADEKGVDTVEFYCY